MRELQENDPASLTHSETTGWLKEFGKRRDDTAYEPIPGLPSPQIEPEVSNSRINFSRQWSLPGLQSSQIEPEVINSQIRLSRQSSLQHYSIRPDIPQLQRRWSSPLTQRRWSLESVEYPKQLLTMGQLIAIAFFAACGGPYGFENTVASGGTQAVFIGLALVPIFWSLPIALMTAELCCMIQENGGHVLWVHQAFGSFVAYLNSWMGFVTSVLNGAVCPALLVDYLNALLYGDSGRMPMLYSVSLRVLAVITCTALNIVGVDIVGSASFIFTLVVVSPVLGLVLLSVPSLNFKWIKSPLPPKLNYGRFLMWMMWNTCGFDAVGTCVMEVYDPENIYAPALLMTIALVVVTYALPTFVGLSVIPDASQWHNGTFMVAAKAIGGNGLALWLGMGALVSSMGLLLAQIFSSARELYGMAYLKQLPAALGQLHKTYGTPWLAILTTSACTILLSWVDFASLAELDFNLYSISMILRMSALVWLRFREPNTDRPYRIPLGKWTLAALALVPMSMCIVVIASAEETIKKVSYAGLAIAVICYGAYYGWEAVAASFRSSATILS